MYLIITAQSSYQPWRRINHLLHNIYKQQKGVTMIKERMFNPPSQQRRSILTGKPKDRINVEPWANSIINGLKQGNGFMVQVNNPSNAAVDFRYVDDQLARIAVLQSLIANETTAGKEINALKDQIGYPPFTFSKVETFYPGSTIPLEQRWEHEGMQTLIPDLSIYPPVDEHEEERRTAVLFGVGNITHLENLERAFLDTFNPCHYCKCFSDAPCSIEGSNYGSLFFVQWSLSQSESAHALGVGEDSPEFNAIMDQLEKQTRELTRSDQNAADRNPSRVRNAILDSYRNSK